jgi:hypothetical protein
MSKELRDRASSCRVYARSIRGASSQHDEIARLLTAYAQLLEDLTGPKVATLRGDLALAKQAAWHEFGRASSSEKSSEWAKAEEQRAIAADDLITAIDLSVMK